MDLSLRRIDELTPHPRQKDVYGDMPDPEFQGLADDIRRFGLRHPVEISNDGFIIDGHQRVRAYRYLGRSEIEVVVLDDHSEEELDERFLRTNFARRQLHPLEMTRIISELYSREQRCPNASRVNVRDRVAHYLTMSPRNADRYLRALTLRRPIQDAVSRRDIGVTKALKVASLSDEKQAEAARRIDSGDVSAEVIDFYFSAVATDPGEETAADRYTMLIEFLAEYIDDFEMNAEQIVGTAARHDEASKIMKQTASFCSKMQELEDRMRRESVAQMRELVDNQAMQ